MALINSYATLSTAIVDYLARGDLASYIPNFIQNTQLKTYRSLRIRPMETLINGVTTGDTFTLPDDYLEMRYLFPSDTPQYLIERTTPELIYARYGTAAQGGRPRYFAREANYLIFYPKPGDGYALRGVYYAMPELLSSTNTSNWFIENAPDLLLYGALLEAQPFLRNDKRIPVWKAMFDESFETVRRQHSSEKFSGGSLAIQVC